MVFISVKFQLNERHNPQPLEKTSQNKLELINKQQHKKGKQNKQNKKPNYT